MLPMSPLKSWMVVIFYCIIFPIAVVVLIHELEVWSENRRYRHARSHHRVNRSNVRRIPYKAPKNDSNGSRTKVSRKQGTSVKIRARRNF